MGKKGEGVEAASPTSPAKGAAASPVKISAGSPTKVPVASPTKVPAASPAKKVPTAAVEELPRAIVRRLVKDKLSQLSTGGKGGEEDVTVHKDALLAFAESARIFIHYLSATANEVCKESKRQTINADDVLKALEDIDFPEFIEPLKVSLEEFRRKNAVKKSGVKAKMADKKRKLDEQLTSRSGDGGEDVAEEEAMEDEDGDAKDN